MSNGESEATTIERLFREWSQYEVTGDLEAWLALVSDDAVFQPPGEPEIRGTEAVRAFGTSFLELPIVAMEPGDLTVFVSESGDLACHVGDLKFALEEEGVRVEHDYKSIVAWRKEAGEWKVVANSWSPNTT